MSKRQVKVSELLSVAYVSKSCVRLPARSWLPVELVVNGVGDVGAVVGVRAVIEEANVGVLVLPDLLLLHVRDLLGEGNVIHCASVAAELSTLDDGEQGGVVVLAHGHVGAGKGMIQTFAELSEEFNVAITLDGENVVNHVRSSNTSAILHFVSRCYVVNKNLFVSA